MSRERTTYSYVVDWDGYPDLRKMTVSGLKLEVASVSSRPSVPAIPQGAQGKVVATTRNVDGGIATVMVQWDGFLQAGPANVSRVRLAKAPDWNAERRQKCCREQNIGCAPLTNGGEVELYNCHSTETQWSEKKTHWCCEFKALRCDDSADVSEDGKHVAAKHQTALRPLFNCSTREEWPHAKIEYCCEHQNLGCPSTTLRGAGSATAPPGWTELRSNQCVDSVKSASTSSALDKARTQLMQEAADGCTFAVVSGGEGAQCASSVAPDFKVEGSVSVKTYSGKVTGAGSHPISVGVGSGACWQLTHKGCSVNATDASGCTQLLFSEQAPVQPQLFG